MAIILIFIWWPRRCIMGSMYSWDFICCLLHHLFTNLCKCKYKLTNYFSDNESRRSSVVLNNNIEVVLLDVSSNKISDIQNLSDCDREFWAKFTCLQKISMSYNKLQTLPEELFKVWDLLHNNLSFNYIWEFI